MNKEEFKKHVIDLINSMDEISSYAISTEPLETTKVGSDWREYKQTGITKIEITGRRGSE